MDRLNARETKILTFLQVIVSTAALVLVGICIASLIILILRESGLAWAPTEHRISKIEISVGRAASAQARLQNQLRDVGRELSVLIAREFDRAISQIILFGTVFGIALAAILLLIWFNYAEKVKEAASLLDQIKQEPDRISREYMKSRLASQLNDLFSSDAITRGAAIRRLLNNSELNLSSYNTLVVALNNEFSRPRNANFIRNSAALVEMMASLNPVETASGLFSMIQEANRSDPNLQHLERLLLGLGEEIYRKPVRDLLTSPLGLGIFGLMLRDSLIDSETACFVLEECEPWMVEQLVAFWLPVNRMLASETIFDCLSRRRRMPPGIVLPFLYPFLDGKLKDRLNNKQRIALTIRCVSSLRDFTSEQKLEKLYASGQLGEIIVRSYETGIRFEELSEVWAVCSASKVLMELLRSAIVLRISNLGSEFGPAMQRFLDHADSPTAG